MRRLALLVLLMVPVQAWGAISHDATTTSVQTNVTTPSYTHTPTGGACANSVALIQVAWQDGTPGTISSVTYGGSAATSLGAAVNSGGNNVQAQTFLYKNSGTSNATVQVNFSEIVNSVSIETRTYCGVDQTTSTGTRATNTGATATPTVTVTSAANELVVDITAVETGTDTTLTVDGSQTQRANVTDLNNHRHGGSEEAGAASVVMSWSLGASRFWASIGIPLKPAAASSRRPIAPILMGN